MARERRRNGMEKNTRRPKLLPGIKMVLWGSAYATFIALVACAQPPNPSTPPYADPGIPSATGPNISTGCDCKVSPTLVRGPGQGDWPQDSTSQANLWSWWTGMYGNPAGWTKLGNFTNGYNCAGYVWAAGRWVNAFDPWLGTTSGCWTKDASGTIRLSDEHVCQASYVGKCGRGPLQNHNEGVYGTMPDVYKKIP
jgi:hypothetical protein